MTGMEKRMADAEAAARKALQSLAPVVAATAGPTSPRPPLSSTAS
jgi:hypothetical protein